jgi:hypothetical protein
MIQNNAKIKRAIRFALNYKHEKALSKLEKDYEKAWEEERNAKTFVPFDEPIFWKYQMFLVLRDDFAQGKEAEFWQNILDKINPCAYGKTKQELLRINLKPYRLDSKEFAKLTLKQKNYFRKCLKTYQLPTEDVKKQYFRRKIQVSYKFTKPHIFKPKIEKLYLTHYQVHIPSRNKQEGYVSSAYIYNKIIRNYWGTWQSRRYQGGTNFRRSLNQQFRAKTSQAMRLFFLENQFEGNTPLPLWKRNFKWYWW